MPNKSIGTRKGCRKVIFFYPPSAICHLISDDRFQIKFHSLCNLSGISATYITMDDAELVNALKAGNTNAFRFLVDKYRNLVWHIVLRMTNRQEDAEDLCQEVFIRVFKQIDRFRGDSKLSTWIGSVTYNCCVDHIRKSKREVLSVSGSIGSINLAQADVSPLLSNIDRNTMKKLVHKIIEKMPLQYRTVITLFHLEEFSYREIEEITGMPEGTVKSYLSRGREIIRQKMTELVPDIQPVLFEA